MGDFNNFFYLNGSKYTLAHVIRRSYKKIRFRSLLNNLSKPCICMKLHIGNFLQNFSIPADVKDEFKSILLQLILLASNQSIKSGLNKFSFIDSFPFSERAWGCHLRKT